MICDKCGATIGPKESACSYCGNTVYERAERDYFKELDELKENMEDLGYQPQNFNQKQFKKLFIGMFIFIFIFIFFTTISMLISAIRFGGLVW